MVMTKADRTTVVTTMAAEVRRTVSFIDLAGYTIATAAHGDETAADLADRLAELTTISLGIGDQLVKGLGDAVMLVSEDPQNALALTGRICRLADDEPAFPLLRVGLHHGPTVERNNDWFGTTVNLAARIAALAGPGQVLGTAEIANAAIDAGMTVQQLGPTALRGSSEPMDVYSIIACADVPDRTLDPICRMAVERSFAVATRSVGGVDYRFCSIDCVAAFDLVNPAAVAT